MPQQTLRLGVVFEHPEAHRLPLGGHVGAGWRLWPLLKRRLGGQLFSKSFRGLTVYKVELFGLEGLAMTMALLVLPFVILWVLIKILPPWQEAEVSLAEATEGTPS